MHQTWWEDVFSEVLNGVPAVVICLRVRRVKAAMAARSRLVYNELDASQNVSSPNITHFRRPFQLALEGGGKAEGRKKKKKRGDNSISREHEIRVKRLEIYRKMS